MTPISHPADALMLMLGIAGVMLAACGVAFTVAVVWGGV
ncbi:hypothetical protein M1M40_gp28 [Halorubrum tailed virus 29]|uniref:Uncharacterized protein n=1 Tax=Halorubrum tailed virus 29 TaxID=2878010 RepID=A0AAE9BZJ3_9CAUD|nr:hypothetical protein M1M40_gp28 [Halorubrum tailed virus 29]UBF23306.1 hypothetical protein HRTV-29_gp28 [Halorubrum tailed virus 29]